MIKKIIDKCLQYEQYINKKIYIKKITIKFISEEVLLKVD